MLLVSYYVMPKKAGVMMMVKKDECLKMELDCFGKIQRYFSRK